MVIAQYPNYLYALTSGTSTQKTNGDWTIAESTWTEIGPAREETSGRGTVHREEDYEDIATTGTVYCPLSCTQVPEGTTIIVSTARIDESATEEQIAALQRTGIVRLKGTCKKFDRSSMHCRIWV